MRSEAKTYMTERPENSNDADIYTSVDLGTALDT